MQKYYFVLARAVWPASVLGMLMLIGHTYGPGQLASYTLALSFVAPAYFVFTFSFPIFIAIRRTRGSLASELMVFRIATVIISAPIVVAAAVVYSPTTAWLVAALWILRMGEMTYDPVAVWVATERGNDGRGGKLLALELARAALVLLTFVLCVYVFRAALTWTIAMAGAALLCIALPMLLTIPKWRREAPTCTRFIAIVRRLFRECGPMTISGALLALLCNLPRLLVDASLNRIESANFGIAQTASSGLALFFNARWIYEIPRISEQTSRATISNGVATVRRLTATFLITSVAFLCILYVIQGWIFVGFNVPQLNTWLLPVLVGALSLQHAISAKRDLLKLLKAYWAEVGVLAVALVAATVAYGGLMISQEQNWVVITISMIVAGVFVQVAMAQVLVQRVGRAVAS